ncbi:MAG: carboxymuconolactone decarboxylase family protein [bacterium]
MASALYEKGMALRRKILGDKHIAKREASGDVFTRQQYEISTEFAYGMLWSRTGLPLKVRSLVTLAMLTALDRPDEIRGHIVGALNNGATKEEIYEVFAQAAGYCGLPASNGATRLFVEVLKEQGLL